MSNQSNNYILGREGEEAVSQLYLQNGYFLLARNFNFYMRSKIGEIDLIFGKNQKIYLIEVKTRSKSEEMQKYGSAASQILKRKMFALFRSYQSFIKQNPQYQNYPAQFDLASIYDGKIKITENAYTFDGF